MEEKIQQFVCITQSSEDVAKNYLDMCDGNVDVAICMHLENEGLRDKDTLSPKTYEEIHGVRAPIPQTSGVLIEEDSSRQRNTRSRKLPQTIFDPFQDYSGSVHQRAHSSNPGHDVARQKLAEMFRPPHDLIFDGTFHEGKLAGQQKKRWLLINLQDSKEFASQILNRDVWSNYDVKELICRSFVFMQIHRISDEGVLFSQFYNITTFPVIAIIDPRTGEKMLSWGSLTATRFIHEVTEFLINNPYHNEQEANSSNQDSVINLSEESQIEVAIQASLEAANSKDDTQDLLFSDDSDSEPNCLSPDKSFVHDTTLSEQSQVVGGTNANSEGDSHNYGGVSNIVSRKRTTSSVDNLESRKKPRTDLDPMCAAIDGVKLTQEEAEGQGHFTVKALNVKGKRSKMLEGKVKNHGASTSGNNTVKELLKGRNEVSQILFRLPDGTRLQRSFLSKEPIREVFRFLEDSGINIEEHEVVTNFPKRSLFDMDHDSSLKMNGLYPTSTVFVHII